MKEKERIVIRPRPARLDEREEAIRILEEAGLLLPPEPLPASYVPISAEKRAELSRKFGVGRPLSQIIMEERAEIDRRMEFGAKGRSAAKSAYADYAHDTRVAST